MKFPGSFISIVVISLLFFAAGTYGYGYVYALLVPDVYGLQYTAGIESIEQKHLTFALIAAAIPVTVYLTWRLIPLYSADKKLFSVFIIALSIFLFVYLRHKNLLNSFKEMKESLINKTSGTIINIPLTELDFENYIAAGLIAGCLFSFLVFHNKTITVGQYHSGDQSGYSQEL